MESSAGTLSLRDPTAEVTGAGPGPQLFVVLHAQQPLQPGSRHGLSDVHAVVLSRGKVAGWQRRAERDTRILTLQLADPFLSSPHARIDLEAGAGGVTQATLHDEGSKNGVLLNGLPVTSARLADGDLIEVGHTLLLFRDAVPGPLSSALDVAADRLTAPTPGLATFSSVLATRYLALARVAPAALPVLITGATGTGKEVVARALHALSGRDGAFVAVNCGALPRELLESELFGHKRGAFSGAIADRPGHFRSAHHGTLLLDEIGDLPLPAQAALLRVLQEREVVPLGESRAVPVDVRVVAATHRDLGSQVAAGTFREDLYARLRGFVLELPALAERREDLGLLVAGLLRRIAGARASQLSFAPRAARALLRHGWPQNVRELEQTLAAGVALAERTIDLAELPPAVAQAAGAPGGGRPLAESAARTREELIAALTAHQGNVSAAARALGTSRMQVHRWAERFAVDLTRFRR